MILRMSNMNCPPKFLILPPLPLNLSLQLPPPTPELEYVLPSLPKYIRLAQPHIPTAGDQLQQGVHATLDTLTPLLFRVQVAYAPLLMLGQFVLWVVVRRGGGSPQRRGTTAEEERVLVMVVVVEAAMVMAMVVVGSGRR